MDNDLIKGNQLITDFLFDDKVPFRNQTITDTMKKLLSGFRASGHVTKILKVTQDEITIKVKDELFQVLWNDVMKHFYIGISSGDMIDGFLYLNGSEPKKKTVQILREVFGLFRSRLDYYKKMADFEQKHPNFFTTF